VDQPVERVCPHCARISYESGARCPYCGRAFRRRSALVGMALLLLLFAVVVLGGMFAMLLVAGREADRKLDREVNRVERKLDGQFNQVRRDVRSELDQRLGSPTATP
jgi:hypothetical protein